jgi:hypothetical protein
MHAANNGILRQEVGGSMKLTAIGALAYALAGSAFAEPLKADIECHSAGRGPVYDCMIRLADANTRAPVPNAKFTVSADMPSMPMAHNLRPVPAAASTEPGVYRVRLALEMYGAWTLRLRISSPVQDQIRKNMDFPEPG